VEQANRFPKIHIFTAQLREMLHRISDRIAMFPQTLGLDPFVQDFQRARSEGFTHDMICGCLYQFSKLYYEASQRALLASQS
jgi:hypothetical protein